MRFGQVLLVKELAVRPLLRVLGHELLEVFLSAISSW